MLSSKGMDVDLMYRTSEHWCKESTRILTILLKRMSFVTLFSLLSIIKTLATKTHYLLMKLTKTIISINSRIKNKARCLTSKIWSKIIWPTITKNSSSWMKRSKLIFRMNIIISSISISWKPITHNSATCISSNNRTNRTRLSNKTCMILIFIKQPITTRYSINNLTTLQTRKTANSSKLSLCNNPAIVRT